MTTVARKPHMSAIAVIPAVDRGARTIATLGVKLDIRFLSASLRCAHLEVTGPLRLRAAGTTDQSSLVIVAVPWSSDTVVKPVGAERFNENVSDGSTTLSPFTATLTTLV